MPYHEGLEEKTDVGVRIDRAGGWGGKRALKRNRDSTRGRSLGLLSHLAPLSGALLARGSKAGWRTMPLLALLLGAVVFGHRLLLATVTTILVAS